MRSLVVVLLVVALPSVACKDVAHAKPPAPAQAPAVPLSAEGLPLSNVLVVKAGGDVLKVAVELAHDDATRTKGLMFRRQLAEDDGMLFLFDESKPLTFWMRNTRIPLDMLFAAADGRIAGIVARAKPGDETPVGPAEPTRYVLEVPGGWCERHGVKAGDRLEIGEALATIAKFRTGKGP